jgi:hypothetical protein
MIGTDVKALSTDGVAAVEAADIATATGKATQLSNAVSMALAVGLFRIAIFIGVLVAFAVVIRQRRSARLAPQASVIAPVIDR